MKKIRRTGIPLHSNELQIHSGIRMKRFDMPDGMPTTEKAGRLLEAHRDDHFIFLVQEKGTSKVMLEFSEVELKGAMMFFILPGQVHHYLSGTSYNGWFIAVETALVGERFLSVFEDQRYAAQSVALPDTRVLNLSLQLLDTYLQSVPAVLRAPAVLQTMIQSFTGLAAGMFIDASVERVSSAGNRPAHLLTRFRKLVAKHYLSEKSPAAYAGKLNLSLSYLNELVKRLTGFPVSYWIREQVLLESKRLLCYTTLDVKEIAYQLGYSDHAYFSRLFRKAEGRTALDFRRGYRVLSNHHG